MSDSLDVLYRDTTVGTLTELDSGLMRFDYAANWLAAPDSFPISISLPFDGQFQAGASHRFFANLLPEGSVREQICHSLKISPSNDFELLRAIGGDCAGALTIVPSSMRERTAPGAPHYQAVTDEQLARWSTGTPHVFSTITGRNEVRLSLAGAQDKLPVFVGDGQIMIPCDGAPSTHILKFPSPHYSHLPENEAFVTSLAREVGLPVADVRLVKTAKASVALITRYDRQWTGGEWIRWHQEDFCQALGVAHTRKYQKEGGPSFRQCVEIIRRHSSYPLADLQRLLQWGLFNWLVGNADAHGKNLSLLYDSRGVPRLAPFYDLVFTRNYRRISRDLAMSLGEMWDPDQITAKHLDELAEDFGFRAHVVSEQVKQLIESLSEQLPVTIEGFARRFGDSPVLERLPQIIRKLIRRARAQLKAG